MLTEHFKLEVQPFGVTPDTRFLYLSHTHREALASLLYGIHSGRGFTALIAPPGMGKTTLLFHVLGRLLEKAKTAFLFQTLCGPEDFLRSLLSDFGIEHEGNDITRMHAKLNAYLLEESKKGRQVVVVIDEAQNLDDRVLELVRMLSNFETPGKKLMHIILSGQPQLAEKLSSERLTQLRQRISIVARLNPFSATEAREYIEHRLRVAGAVSDKPLFSKQAYLMIAEQSAGIPRNINNLCFNSMSLACALKRHQVDGLMVQEAINDLDLATLALAKKYIVPKPARASVFGKLQPRFTAWRHGVSLAFASFISLGVLVHVWGPSRDTRLPGRAARLSQPVADTANSEVAPASNILEQERQNEQITQPEQELQLNARPVTSALNVPSTISAARRRKNVTRTNLNRPLAETGVSNIYANENQTAPDILEFGTLREDLAHLQHSSIVELLHASQIPDTTQPAAEQNHVPFEHGAQREKP
jgi:general secretion pathway protein A